MSTGINSRLWLASAGILEAAISTIYFLMYNDGALTFHAWNGAVAVAGELAILAGACTIAASIWKAAGGQSWMLAPNGLALGALGLMQYAFTRFRISFVTVALLIILMALSTSMVELLLARTMRRRAHDAYAWFLGAAGIISAAFVLLFLALCFRWITMEPRAHADVLSLGCYFGWSAIGVLGMALRPHSPADLPRLASPKHAI